MHRSGVADRVWAEVLLAALPPEPPERPKPAGLARKARPPFDGWVRLVAFGEQVFTSWAGPDL